MLKQIPQSNANDIETQVLERFRKVADGPQGHFVYPTGRDGLLTLNYSEKALRSLPSSVQSYYCGVGNPFAPGLPEEGWKVLDVGCGAGVDALVASVYAGPHGQVVGLEFSPEMRNRAEANAKTVAGTNTLFMQGNAEKLPFEDNSFDLLISNGVYNLVLRKRQALSEAFRVLRPGGRLQVADQILEGDAPPTVNPLGPSAWAT